MIRESARVIVKSTFKRLGLEVVHREQNASALIEEIYGERDLLLTNVEAEQLFRVVRSVSKVPGDIAEVGVYTGASSRIIREAEPLKAFHLFDTFAGLPAPSTKDNRFQAGSYRSSLSDVKHYLDHYSGLQFYPGVFPSTAGPVENHSFSFVHLDVDLYQSTIDALKFFWPRMATHGVILSHDYSTSTGVPAAFDEFFLSQPTPVIQLSDSYCLVMR